MNNVTALALLLPCFVASMAVYAEYEQDDLFSLYDEEELVSIATGTEKQVRFAPSVATVITAQDIKDSGVRTLDEALEMVPGLHVSASFNRQDAIYSIRGIHTGANPQVLLLVDGVQISQVFSGARPYNYTLPVANIDRIEVIRGPGSAVYGADAFAGVISVTTKSAANMPVAEVGGRLGSFDEFSSIDTRETWLRVGTDVAGVNVSLSLNHVTTDGDDSQLIHADAQSQQINIGNASASSVPGPIETRYELLSSQLAVGTESWQINAFGWNISDAGAGVGAAQALDPEGNDNTDYFGVNFAVEPQHMTDTISVSGKLGFTVLDQNAEFTLYPAGAVFLAPFPDGVIGNPSTQEKTYFGETVAQFSAVENHAIRLAVGLSLHELKARETKNFSDFVIPPPPGLPIIGPNFGVLTDVTGTSEIYIDNKDREHYYISLQDEWRIANDWELTGGIRYDSFTQFGESLNPRLALVWSTTHDLTTKFLYGRAFRAPSMSELFAKNNPTLLGNKNLDPETIDTFEVAFDYRPTAVANIRLNLFYYEIDDLIDIQFGVPAQNAIEQSGYGSELELSWRLSDVLEMTGNYAWQRSENDDSGLDIPNAPQQQLYLRTVWDVSQHMKLSGVLNWVADRERGKGDPRGSIDDFTTFDLVARYAGLAEGLDIALAARNLFNDNVFEPSVGQASTIPEIPGDYPMEGRSLNIEMTYQLFP